MDCLLENVGRLDIQENGGKDNGRDPPDVNMDEDTAEPERPKTRRGAGKQTKKQNKIEQLHRQLAFRNPGSKMWWNKDFNSETSTREMRKMNRRIYKQNISRNQQYDENGRLIEDQSDMCDCLVRECPGCQYPCAKCGSEMCGVDCRIQRKYRYESVEVEGADQKWYFMISQRGHT